VSQIGNEIFRRARADFFSPRVARVARAADVVVARAACARRRQWPAFCGAPAARQIARFKIQSPPLLAFCKIGWRFGRACGAFFRRAVALVWRPPGTPPARSNARISRADGRKNRATTRKKVRAKFAVRAFAHIARKKIAQKFIISVAHRQSFRVPYELEKVNLRKQKKIFRTTTSTQ
jgi:hypothetical protein